MKPLQTHQDCPHCNHKKCLSEFETGSYCWSENKWYPDPAFTAKTPDDIVSFALKGYRGISKKAIEHYGTLTGKNAKSEDVTREYSYPTQNKTRILPKNFSGNSGFKNNELFGIDKFNVGSGRYLTIVEGEDDAPAAYEMLGFKWPVVAISGTGAVTQVIKNNRKSLEAYDQIVLAFDGDDAGTRAMEVFSKAFPNKCYKVELTKHNDPQQYLDAGDKTDFIFAWNNRKKFVPKNVYNTPNQFVDILSAKETNKFIPTSISSLNELITGIMQGHMTLVTAPEGLGKTELLRLFEHTIIKHNTDVNIAVLHMEESKKTTLTTYGCYELETNLRDPEHTVSQGDINKSIRDLTVKENLYLFDFTQDRDPREILDEVRYFATACECKYIFIDPIQQLAYASDSDDTEEKVLSQISVELERLCTDLDIGIIMTAHVNDDGATRSSRMIGKSASVRINLERDLMNADDDIRNTTKLFVNKNRPTGKTGYGGSVIFNPDTFMLHEVD